MRQIAFYGKGGIGKSNTITNLAVILSRDLGKRVLQLGCNPKHDSTMKLLGGRLIPTVLDTVRDKGREGIVLEMIQFKKPGYEIYCVEAGGPAPAVGCAGRGIIAAVDLLKSLKAFDNQIDYLFYDVLGDVVCGGFGMPIREGHAQEIYLVVSGELMALYAANNIARTIKKFAQRSKSRLGGLICNSRNVKNEKDLVEEFAGILGTKLIQFIPRDPIVQEAEVNNLTVMEYAPDSPQATIYKELAQKIVNNKDLCIPEPISIEKLNEIVFKTKMTPKNRVVMDPMGVGELVEPDGGFSQRDRQYKVNLQETMKQIAIYGNAGIGKSTVTSNISMVLGKNNKVLQVGCDPKHDSTALLLGGRLIPTVLETSRDLGRNAITREMILFKKENHNIWCVEAGGPDPGMGCAGRGVVAALQMLEQLELYNEGFDFVLYDVLGDVVCGGFAKPIQAGYAREMYIVASGELMSLYAANNMCKAIKALADEGSEVKLGGIIGNSRGVKNEEDILLDFTGLIKSRLIQFIPWDEIVQEAESARMTVIEFAPSSRQSEVYRNLAYKVSENKEFSIPSPTVLEEIQRIALKGRNT